MKIEAIFGGALALFVLAVAVYAIINGGRGGTGAAPIFGPNPDKPVATRDEFLCSCFNDGFDLAGSNVGVMSAQYRTGFEYCRAQLGDDGGYAWTAGWNARVSARPFEASCRTYLRRHVG